MYVCATAVVTVSSMTIQDKQAYENIHMWRMRVQHILAYPCMLMYRVMYVCKPQGFALSRQLHVADFSQVGVSVWMSAALAWISLMCT